MDSALKVVVASALSNIHPGAGRAPGAVDLPVSRDPLGYPYIPGSSVKGAVKTGLARRMNCVGRNGDGAAGVACGRRECRVICCLLGREPRDGGEGASAVSIMDMVPVAIPGPALTMEGGCSLGGVVYAAPRSLAAKARGYLEAAGVDGGLAEVLDAVIGSGPGPVLFARGCRGRVEVLAGGRIEAEAVEPPQAEGLEVLAGLNPLYKAAPPASALLAVDDSLGRLLVERFMHRVTRVRIDRATKTVVQHALWTEEYIPWGTLFIGLIAETGFQNENCKGVELTGGPVEIIARRLEQTLKNTLIVGGKETVGAGVLRLKLL
ncbi:type III-B CRISPR module RAMP protein Cmr4 [Aeropyrum pernix]|uniref:Type III-B CRISPR module RAMP protein Cmr4 n=2 Tax=Aeropyrum pernix TaxID=56636 RepID=A0A401H9N2_AERPX|nr:type III-B CRISPR module RAMP protein Cmr4 [Aeropyrum pernix]